MGNFLVDDLVGTVSLIERLLNVLGHQNGPVALFDFRDRLTDVVSDHLLVHCLLLRNEPGDRSRFVDRLRHHPRHGHILGTVFGAVLSLHLRHRHLDALNCVDGLIRHLALGSRLDGRRLRFF